VDIDLTILVQFFIFLVLLVVLNKLVFKPFLALRKERADNIEGARSTAGQLDASADDKIESYEDRIKRARNEAALVRSELRREGDAKASEILGKAHQRSAAKLKEARRKMAQSVEDAQASLRTQASGVARAIASKLLDREV
jgi:F-type H+-transporting ATPase subunit b